MKIEKSLAVAFLEDKGEKSYTTLKQRELQITNKLKEVNIDKDNKIKEKLKNTQDKLESEGIGVILNEVCHIDREITSVTQSIANVDLAIDEIKKHFFSIIDTNIIFLYNSVFSISLYFLLNFSYIIYFYFILYSPDLFL